MAETIEAWKARAAQFEAALRAVERWSFDAATDLTDAGHSWWPEWDTVRGSRSAGTRR